MNKMRRNILIISVIVICFMVGGVTLFMRRDTSYEISNIRMSYAFDHDDLKYYMRDVDYVFLGNIEKEIGTDYEEKEIINGEEVSTPYTKYEVKVTKTLKGDFSQGDNIQIKKMGGISENGKQYYLCEDDVIPEEGKNYIFLGYVQPNGELLVAGKNSTIEKGETELKNKIEKLLPDVKKEGDTKRQRFQLDEQYK